MGLSCQETYTVDQEIGRILSQTWYELQNLELLCIGPFDKLRASARCRRPKVSGISVVKLALLPALVVLTFSPWLITTNEVAITVVSELRRQVQPDRDGKRKGHELFLDLLRSLAQVSALPSA